MIKQNKQMMKNKTCWILMLAMMLSSTVLADSARRGIQRTITFADGTSLTAQLTGDEHAHCWRTADGRCFVEKGDGQFLPVAPKQLKAQRAARLQKTSQRRAQKRQARMLAAGNDTGTRTVMGTIGAQDDFFLADFNQFEGKKKGLVILAQFDGLSFRSGHDNALYNRILNERNYTSSEGFIGSVHDYFLDQSNGKFDLTFDVVGPVTLSHEMSYYGQNEDGFDKRPGEMVAEACLMADSLVNFADYDWDGDGAADQIFVLYAGRGESTGGAANTIWPHEWSLAESDYGRMLRLDGVVLDTYACSNEMGTARTLSGIGTFCHEFSHCLGYADHYDVDYEDGLYCYGMGSWDLMDNGDHNDDGFCPAGYTAFEKYCAGWTTPVVLGDEPLTVEKMLPTVSNGDTYVIFNDDNRNECFFLENRYRTGWDAAVPASGLLVTHLDYDREVWEWNMPNAAGSYYGDYNNLYNSHPRYTVVPADNKSVTKYSFNATGDPFPYGKKDSLTAVSKPAMAFYDGKALLNKSVRRPLTRITRKADGTVAFVYGGNLDKMETGIKSTAPDRKEGSSVVDVYTPGGLLVRSGVRRSEALDGLPRGLYVVGGVKMLR